MYMYTYMYIYIYIHLVDNHVFLFYEIPNNPYETCSKFLFDQKEKFRSKM